ncbi:MAG: hypothetical protein HFI26_13705 [Lachnospiraceae bacterium]|jgi:peptide/nickel transport system ATP-binding protein|nr:hypothetical protein [Lachnospiraceae bacterium]
MKCNKQLKYGNYVAFGHFHGTAVNNSGLELGTIRQVYKNILHPYTKGLFESLPGYSKGKRLKQINGLMPDPAALPPLCKFEPRCPYSCEQCKKEMPKLIDAGDGHLVRCLRAQKGQV